MTLIRFVRACGACVVLAKFAPVLAAADIDIEFGLNNKPPLFYFDQGNAQGDVVEVARQACKLASLRCSFSELPFQRILYYLEQRRPGFVALGFSKTREREKFVTFSEPVWLDDSPVLMSRAADKNAFLGYTTLADMVARSRYTFCGKAGNSYPIDNALQAMGSRDIRFNVEAIRFPLLLTAKRCDFTTLYPAEILPALQASGVPSQEVVTFTYPDMARGEQRYMLFSQKVSIETIERMNVALKALRQSGKIATLR
jgi:ABC-type amino acid transport substrate-binding protein